MLLLIAYSPSMSLTFTASADGVSTPLSTTLSIDTTNAIVLQTIEGFDAVLGNPNANLQVKVNGKGSDQKRRRKGGEKQK